MGQAPDGASHLLKQVGPFFGDTMKRRASGVLCHVTSLPSPFGIGDLGPGAYRFAEFLHEASQSFWQVLPLNPTNERLLDSPSSASRPAAETRPL